MIRVIMSPSRTASLVDASLGELLGRATGVHVDRDVDAEPGGEALRWWRGRV